MPVTLSARRSCLLAESCKCDSVGVSFLTSVHDCRTGYHKGRCVLKVIRIPGILVVPNRWVRLTSNAAAQSDIDLLRAIIARDADAFMALYDRYHRLAFGLAYRMLDDPSRAEEAVQDAFMQVWNRAESFDFDRGGNVRGWVMTIVHHRSIDLHRRHGRHDAQSVSLDDHLELRAKADIWTDVSRNLTQEEMRGAMDTLPEDQRRAIELAYFGGLSQTEIARREQLPLGTVKGRMRLGLNKLRTVLTSFDQERAGSDRQGFS